MMINRLPAPTWRWLKMNSTDVSMEASYENITIIEEIPDNVYKTEKTGHDINCRTGLGEEAAGLFDSLKGKVSSFEIKDGDRTADPIRLTHEYGNEGAFISGEDVVVGEDAEATIVMIFSSDRTSKGDAFSSFRYHVKKGGRLTLIQVQMLGAGYRLLNDIGGIVDEGGEFALYQVILSGKESYCGSFADLHEKKSALTADIAYLLKDEEVLDMNYVADHTGRKTVCDINAAGVLRDRSKKIFRGTIDFHKGCSGSSGTEMEEVLLMDEGVINQTIPLILCDEEDVEGNHGASLGRIDENVLFYLRSRGIPDEEIYEMMARAKIDRICNHIDDSRTVETIQEYLK